MSEMIIGSVTVLLIAALHAYVFYYVLSLEKRRPTETLIPDEA